MAGVPLPTDTSTVWPPADLAPITADLAEADAWWSGDPARLAQHYGRDTGANSRRRFWAKPQPTGTKLDRIHLPIAGDIAAVGADLLFGDDLVVTVPGAHDTQADPQAVAAEQRLTELIDQAGLATQLLEGAEVCGGLGGVYLRPAWDPAVANHPMLDVVHADRAVPEWRWGRLVAVTFWRELAREGQTIWRYLERYEPGWILHGLYAGDRDRLGVRLPLTKRPETADLEDEINLGAVLGDDHLMLSRYVPNARPNRRRRGRPEGRPDTAGLEPLMDALDETWTSWVRDIRLGKARLIVPDEFLDRSGRGQGASFDTDREIFSPLSMDPSDVSAAGITPVQFAIRTQEHADTAKALVEQIITMAQYSPQTFGLDGTAAATATEIRAREAKTLRTTNRKRRYWTPALTDVAEMLLLIDRRVFNGQAEPVRPAIAWPELAMEDPHRLAETLTLLKGAQAASIETRVRMAQPDLDQDAVAAEVGRIMAEEAIVADPTGGFV